MRAARWMAAPMRWWCRTMADGSWTASPPGLDALPEVVGAVGTQCEVLMDGGIRRGGDIVKALALGARAVLLGRGTAYGLAAGGEKGVDRALAIFHADLVRTMKLLGCASPARTGRVISAEALAARCCLPLRHRHRPRRLLRRRDEFSDPVLRPPASGPHRPAEHQGRKCGPQKLGEKKLRHAVGRDAGEGSWSGCARSSPPDWRRKWKR